MAHATLMTHHPTSASPAGGPDNLPQLEGQALRIHLLGLLMYAYARGNRSSRGIERSCMEDVAYRVIAANRVPDHSTIAEFRVRHEQALAELFGGVLELCKQAGLASVGVIAVDGTKVTANASSFSDADYRRIAREILEEAARIDQAEDELYGDARGDELPEHLRTAEGRRAALKDAKRKLEQERRRTDREHPAGEQPLAVREPVAPARDENQGALFCAHLEADEIVTRSSGRQRVAACCATSARSTPRAGCAAGSFVSHRAAVGGRAATVGELDRRASSQSGV